MISLNPETRLSPNFRAIELTRSDTARRLGIDNRPNQGQLENARKLAQEVLEPIREEFGPLRVTSWLRVPELNHKIPGSSRRSYHQFGLAADVVPVAASLSQIMAFLGSTRIPFDVAIYEYGAWLHIQSPIATRHPRRLRLRKSRGRKYEAWEESE